MAIERPLGINYEVEEGTLLLINGQLVITREKFSLDKTFISASRVGRWRYKSHLTTAISQFTRCFFDPAANLITDDGSPKSTLPIEDVDNAGSALLMNLNVNPGVETDNWIVECSNLVTSVINTPVLSVKNTGYTGTVATSGVYTGTGSGQATIQISRRGDLSGVSPRTALVQVSGALPSNEYEVVGDTPIDIGDGLSITFGTDGVFGDWLFLGDTWYIDVTPSIVGLSIPDIGNTSSVISVVSGGTYAGAVDEAYTVAIQNPGGSGVATVIITSSSGNDNSGPLTVNDGVPIPLGLRGGTITFTGITNLDALDYWTVACTAATALLTEGTLSTGYSGIVSASGSFTSPLDDTYTIEIVKGGPVGVAEATITSINGDNVEILLIVAGQLQMGSFGVLIEFSDSDELAPGDTWTVDCTGERTEWTVTGDITGLIDPIAITDIAYISDDGLIEFYIIPGSITTEVGDRFTFSTFAAAIPAGIFLTSGTVFDEDMVFLLNSDKQIT